MGELDDEDESEDSLLLPDVRDDERARRYDDREPAEEHDESPDSSSGEERELFLAYKEARDKLRSSKVNRGFKKARPKCDFYANIGRS